MKRTVVRLLLLTLAPAVVLFAGPRLHPRARTALVLAFTVGLAIAAVAVRLIPWEEVWGWLYLLFVLAVASFVMAVAEALTVTVVMHRRSLVAAVPRAVAAFLPAMALHIGAMVFCTMDGIPGSSEEALKLLALAAWIGASGATLGAALVRS